LQSIETQSLDHSNALKELEASLEKALTQNKALKEEVAEARLKYDDELDSEKENYAQLLKKME